MGTDTLRNAAQSGLDALLRLKRAFFKSASTPEEIAQGCERGFDDYEAEWVVPSLQAIKLLQAALVHKPTYFQVYRCKIKSKEQINAEIPREKQGWWADVCPGQTLNLRQAVQADIERCSLNAAHSRNPEDYMCETFTSGALVAKYAIEFMNPEQNVFAAVPTTVT